MRFIALFLTIWLLSFPISANETIKIGYINSYTGLPHFIERGNRVAQMLVSDLNAQGGINGQPVDLLIRDDRAQAGDAITIVQELINRDKVVALAGLSFTHISLAITQIADKNQIPYFAGWCASSKCPRASQEYLFSIEEYAIESGKKLAQLAAKNSNAKRWVVLGNTIEWTFAISGAFKKELKRLKPDIQFIDDMMYGFGKADSNQAIQAMKAHQVDGVFNALFGKELASYLRAARARNFMNDITHVSAYLAPEEMSFLGQEAPVGWLAMGYPEEHLNLFELDRFITQYKALYNGQNPGITGLIAAVNLNLLFETLKKSDDLSGETLANTAKTIEAKTPIGIMSYDPKNHRANFSYWYGRIALDKSNNPYLEVMP